MWVLFFYFCLSLHLDQFQPVYSESFNCSTVPSNTQDMRQTPRKWTLVQYNVEWLFTENSSSCPGICTWNTTADQYTHLNTIKNVLTDLNADTVHLCEVQSCTQLDQVKPSDAYHSYMIQGNDTYTGQNVGLLTKVDPVDPITRTELRYAYPIEGSQCGYTGEGGSEGVSKHLITRFMIENISIYMVGAHLLSNPNDPEACAKREAQAQVLQTNIEKYIADGHEVVVLGDFNDYDGVYKDINSNEPNSKVIETLEGKAGDSPNYTLYSVAAKIFQEDRYTEWYDEDPDCAVEKSEYSMIDHILVSKELYLRIEYVEYYHKYREGCNTYQSDHYPILVTFRF